MNFDITQRNIRKTTGKTSTDRFEDALQKIIEPCKHQQEIKTLMMNLYEILRDHAKRANLMHRVDKKNLSIPYTEVLYRIQRIIKDTPLTLMLNQLVEDDLLEIRAAAKTESCDRLKAYCLDEETQIGYNVVIRWLQYIMQTDGPHPDTDITVNDKELKYITERLKQLGATKHIRPIGYEEAIL